MRLAAASRRMEPSGCRFGCLVWSSRFPSRWRTAVGRVCVIALPQVCVSYAATTCAVRHRDVRNAATRRINARPSSRRITAAGADDGGGILHLPSSVARAPPRLLNGLTLSRMWHPAHVEGRTLVVIRARRSLFGGYDVIESGMLEDYGGGELRLVGDHGSRVVTDAELESLQPVLELTEITACRGFDFFLLRPQDAG